MIAWSGVQIPLGPPFRSSTYLLLWNACRNLRGSLRSGSFKGDPLQSPDEDWIALGNRSGEIACDIVIRFRGLCAATWWMGNVSR
jgi:hypothetical protein